MTDIDPGELPPALGAASYPIWVILLGAAVIAAFGYSLVSLPGHIMLARTLAAGHHLEEAQDYTGAEREYAAVLAEMPGSRKARLGMAHAMFADEDKANDGRALELIAPLRLHRSDWDLLAPVMPPEYRSQFVSEPR